MYMAMADAVIQGKMPPKYRTKFPIARIKRIMQVDEEIGKVAQATPILISKAIEMFLQNLIDRIVEESKTVGKVTPFIVKKTINGNEQFDFLRPIVENIAEESEEASEVSPKKARTRNSLASPADEQ